MSLATKKMGMAMSLTPGKTPWGAGLPAMTS
jgi:hypothetical protein